MGSTPDTESTAPSRRGLIRSALVALVAAVAVIVFFVMPAEYGTDPTGVGAKLGLLDLAATTDDSSEPSGGVRQVVGTYPGIPEQFDFYEPEVLGEPFSKTQDVAFRTDVLTIDLDVGEQVEYKAIMHQGDTIVYAWSVDDGAVYTDFHADPGENAEGYPDQYYIRYRESETAQSAGSLVAPFDGNHGWYWLNIEEHPVRITLKLTGYYERIDELFRSYQ